MQKIDLIIYDLDGTLIDSLADIADSVNRTMAHFRLPLLPQDKVRQYVGTGARKLIRAMSPASADFEALFAYFLADYDSHLLDKTVLYPGVRETLEYFKWKKQVIFTNKPTDLSEKIVKGLGIDRYFSRIWGSDSGLPLKPDPAGILKLLEELRVSPHAAWIIGDSPVDIEAGKRAGIRTCAVTYGLRDAEELAAAGPDLTLASIDGLCQYLSRPQTTPAGERVARPDRPH